VSFLLLLGLLSPSLSLSLSLLPFTSFPPSSLVWRPQMRMDGGPADTRGSDSNFALLLRLLNKVVGPTFRYSSFNRNQRQKRHRFYWWGRKRRSRCPSCPLSASLYPLKKKDLYLLSFQQRQQQQLLAQLVSTACCFSVPSVVLIFSLIDIVVWRVLSLASSLLSSYSSDPLHRLRWSFSVFLFGRRESSYYQHLVLSTNEDSCKSI